MGNKGAKIVCIGSVLWDIIGSAEITLSRASDVAGRIKTHPGGVAFNIARQLGVLGFKSVILTAFGDDIEGDLLLKQCQDIGMDTQYVFRLEGRRTDQYMAIEDAGGVVAAIADAFTLEAAGNQLLRPFADGTLGSARTPFNDILVLDGNLPAPVLEEIAESRLFSECDLRLCPASPSKAARLRPFLGVANATFYCNFTEAQSLCDAKFTDAKSAASGLLKHGAKRAVVTSGNGVVCDRWEAKKAITCRPPEIDVKKVTGAGDTFMATHLAAELNGYPQQQALNLAVDAAAAFVSDQEIQDVRP